MALPIWLGAALLCTGLIGCGKPANSGAATAEVATEQVVIGSTADVDAWNEYLSQQAFAAGILRRVYLRLAEPRADAEAGPQSYAPQLAESW